MRSKAKARKVAQSEDDDPEFNDGGESVSDDDSCDGSSPNDFTSELLPMAFTQPIQPALCHLDDTAVPPELELRESQVHGLGIWTRVHIPAATQFGPFFGKLRSVPLSSAHAWQVTDVSGKTIGWFDTNEPGAWNWMKYVRTVSHPQQHNVKSTLVKGQVYYQAIHDIEAGEEVLVSDRRVLQSEGEEATAVSEAQPAESGGEEKKCEGDLTAAANFSASSLLPPASIHQELDHSQLDLSQHSELSDHLGLLSQDSSSPEPLRSVSHLLFGSSEEAANGSSYKCVACDQTFTDVLRLDEHMVVDHYGQDSSCHTGEYKCDQCPKVFSWKSNLLRHQVAHEDGRRYVCENCHKVFTDPSNLQRHIRSQHIGARSHACPECGKTFATSSGLKQHTHIHSSVKPFQCEVCLKSYTQFSNLCRHKRMHADCRMQIKCHKCGQAFSTVTSLSKHKRFCEGASLTSSSSSSNASSGNPLLGFPHPHTPSNPSNEKVSPLSIAQSNNPLMFYPRPGFPFYPPSLVAYPMFAGAGLPPHPSLLASSPLLMPAASVKKPDSPDSSGQASAASATLNGTLVRAEVAIKKEKRGSEGSESEISDDVSSAGISDDVDVSTGSDFDSESDHDPRSKMEKHLHHQLKLNTPNGKRMTPEMHASSLFTSPRESSPKQAAIYPELPPNLKDPLLSANGMIKALTVTCPPADMPFDLSINSKSQHMSPAAKPAPESTKEDEPLDLRMDHKKAPKHEEGSHHKTHVFGETKKAEMERTTPVTPVSVGDTALSPTKFQMAYPRPIHPLLVDPQLYKPKFPAFPTPERVMMPFPPRYPLLNPLMNGLNGNSSAFDMIRSQMEKMGKPYQDVLTPHVNKLKERYSCKFCGKIFPRSANLTRHLRTHTGEQPYKCKYCERSFSISSNLQRHVRNIHNKEKPFKCPLCDRCFGQQTNLDRHLKKHESDGPTILDDSPKSADLNDKDDAYFDEIRNFIGKVTDGDPAKQGYGASDLSSAAFPLTAPDLKVSPGAAAKTTAAANGSKSDLDDEEEDDEDDAPLVKRSKVDSDGEGRTSPCSSPKTPGRSSGAATPLLRSKSVAYEVMMQFNKGPDDAAPTTDKEPSENSSRTASPLPNFCKDLSKTMGVCEKAVEV